jgi:hypothetical protein
MSECCSEKCAHLAKRDKRKVVWLVDGNPYCNVCFLNWIEEFYADIRTQKRRRRTHEPNPCGAPMQMRA